MFIGCFQISFMSGQAISGKVEQSERKGKHYRFPEFKKGEIVRKNGITSKADLNYNFLTQEMIIDLGTRKIAYEPLDSIKEVIIGDITFIPWEGSIYEQLFGGDMSLLVHRKQLMERTGQQTGLGRTSGTYSSNTNTYSNEPDQIPSLEDKVILYELILPGNFGLKEVNTYYLFSGMELTLLRRLRQFENIFPARATEIREFIKKKKLKFDREEDIIDLVRFCDSD